MCAHPDLDRRGLVDYDDDVFNGGKRDDDGFILGAGAGYDFQMGQFVAGIEAEFTESTLDREYQEQGLRPALPIATPITAIKRET